MVQLAQKLKIKENMQVVLLNEPVYARQNIGALPTGAHFVNNVSDNTDIIILFVKNKAELQKHFSKAIKALKKNAMIWVCFPKGSSGIQTDLNRDNCLEFLNTLNKQFLTLIAFDETWSAFAMRNAPGAETKKEVSDRSDNLTGQWIDSATRTVKIPHYLDSAMKKAGVADFFNSLAFSHKKEYVLWIVSAKQEKTRLERIEKAVEKMKSGLKNPSMK